ncbi:unnamed protein product, partial [Trichogramma brassicae]
MKSACLCRLALWRSSRSACRAPPGKFIEERASRSLRQVCQRELWLTDCNYCK